MDRVRLLSLVGCLLAAAAVTAAPTGQLVTRILDNGRDDVKASSADGSHVVKQETVEETKVHVPGGSSATAAHSSSASTPDGRQTSTSAVIGTGSADPGQGGLSATIATVDGGAGTDGDRAGSDATALVGSIAVNNGEITTSTAIARTRGDSSGGSKTDALGLTTSQGEHGSAQGVQYTGSEAGAAGETTTQADLTIGSSVGGVGSQVSVTGGTKTTNEDPPEVVRKKDRLTIIDRAKRLLARGGSLKDLRGKEPSPSEGSDYPSAKIPPSSGGSSGGTVEVDSGTVSAAGQHGGTTSAGALESKASTLDGSKSSKSAVYGVTEAQPGKGGLSASVTSTDGGGGVGEDGTGTAATLLSGSIAINKGQISTSTGVIHSKGDNAHGTRTDALALTSSVGDDGRAQGVQHSSASTGSAEESKSQANVAVGSSVGEIGTAVNLGGETEVVGKPANEKSSPLPFLKNAQDKLKKF